MQPPLPKQVQRNPLRLVIGSRDDKFGLRSLLGSSHFVYDPYLGDIVWCDSCVVAQLTAHELRQLYQATGREVKIQYICNGEAESWLGQIHKP